jgi:hypothetical protein
MFYLISKDPMTQYLLRIEKSFCNDNFRINFLLFFLSLSPHNDRAIVIVLMGSLNSRMGVSSLTSLSLPHSLTHSLNEKMVQVVRIENKFFANKQRIKNGICGNV